MGVAIPINLGFIMEGKSGPLVSGGMVLAVGRGAVDGLGRSLSFGGISAEVDTTSLCCMTGAWWWSGDGSWWLADLGMADGVDWCGLEWGRLRPKIDSIAASSFKSPMVSNAPIPRMLFWCGVEPKYGVVWG